MSTVLFPTLAVSIIRRRLTLAVLAVAVTVATTLSVAPHARAQQSAIDFVEKIGETAIADLTDPNISDSERVKRMRSYAALFKKYNGQKILMQRAQPLGNDEINVIGVIRQPSGPDIDMEMRVHMVKGAYRALDLKIEGVSMPLSHQKQFASVITQRGNKVSGLISALKATTDRFEAQTPSQ